MLVTVSKCGRHYIVDAAGEEEAHVDRHVRLFQNTPPTLLWSETL